MTENELPPKANVTGKNFAGSGVVLGVAGGMLLWLVGLVGPVYFLPIVVAGAIVGALVFGIPGVIFERKVNRERKAVEDEIAARKAAARDARRAAAAAAPSQPQVVVVVGPGQTAPYPGAAPGGYYPGQAAPSRGSSTWAPTAAASAGGGSAAAAAVMVEETTKTVPTWPLTEPLCYMETGREKDVWEVVRKAQIAPDKFIGFTTAPCESVCSDLGFPVDIFRKISRIEAEDSMAPGDLERIGNYIERHLEGGEGRVVVLPGLENLVEAGNVRNVRRLLEVLRDLAQGSHGSILVALDPGSLPEASVTLLERGAHRLD